MADQKANIIIASSCIILSITITRLDAGHTYWEVWSLLLTCVISLLTSFIVVAPINLKHKVPASDNPQFNPLFFYHFTTISYKNYQLLMDEILSEPEHIHEAMVRDIYQLGQVLAKRKYPFLKLSSFIFILGMVLSSIFFLIEINLI